MSKTTPRRNFSEYQNDIYQEGMFGNKVPDITTNLADLEDSAKQHLSQDALGYVLPSAGSGATAKANRAAFEKWHIEPRMLRGSPQRDLSCSLLGTQMPAPLMIAPMGIQTLAHPDGELATARAAATLGIPYIHSTQAAHSFEEVADANGSGPRWFQLYWPTNEAVCISFLKRAKASGFSTLVLTLDTVLMGWRPADLDRGFLPFLHNKGLANWLTDPAFLSGLGKPAAEDPVAAALHWVKMFPNPGLSWSDLPFLRKHWDGPIVLKGIVSPADAILAAEHGMDGIVVSNHGGRQIDGAVAALDALPLIAETVGDKLTVLFDSGTRTGVDVTKALALGAQVVLLGRPVLYGLALRGQSGVEHVLRCFLAELDLTLALSGYASHRELARNSLRPV
ncbi:alpha-hydroxy-acid oxidizing protein [Phyllobacterium sp. OV277]|uniref:alpha-hydroxy-acid oxidizing protein n=1 Tax=Phyllobacterium sp. OV277 TaxID=1882772 RepID=UPI00088C6B7A|nr:alpha-hydroxy-acid oxidizing protein [Phyllobacterium sp. OV277]SDP68133.1 FMN-dependent dehydrogenase, includes L-lactate dehydrogenase and type II isopentenyl diphosphate isomerase [Phyllobacterium sp. OV277]